MAPVSNPRTDVKLGTRPLQTGRLTGPAPTASLGTAPFAELASMRPPALEVPDAPGLDRLRKAFGRGVDAPGPATRALFEMVVKGAVSPAMADFVIANRQGVAEMRQNAAALRPQLENLPTPAWALSNAALDMVTQAQHFGDLADTQSNRDRAAGFIAERLAEHVAPFKRELRPAVKEAFLTGTLTQPTLDALGPKGVKRFVAAMRPQLALVDAMPGTHMPLLREALGATVAALRKEPAMPASKLVSAVRARLKGGALERFDATQVRAQALVAAAHLPAGPIRPVLAALKSRMGDRVGQARAAAAEAARIDAKLKKDLAGFDKLLAKFHERSQAGLGELSRGELVPRAKLSAFVGQVSGVVAEAQGKLGGLSGGASMEARLKLGEASQALGGLKGDVSQAVDGIRGAATSAASNVKGAVIGNNAPKTISGGVSGTVQGSAQVQGHYSKQLRDPNAGPTSSEKLIGNALDAIPDMDKSGEVHGSFGVTKSAHSEGSVQGALGSASYHANASMYARGEAYAKGGIKKSGGELAAYGQAGFKLEAGFAADADFKANLLGGLVKADGQVSAVVRAEVHADVAGSLTVGRDAQGRIQLHAQASADIGASVEANVQGHINLNVGGMEIAAEGQAGVMVGFRAQASAEVGLKDGKFSIGASLKLSFIVGFNLNFRLSFKMPKFLTNFSGALSNAKKAIVGGLKHIGKSIKNVGKSIKNVGASVGKAAKKIGKVLSKL